MEFDDVTSQDVDLQQSYDQQRNNEQQEQINDNPAWNDWLSPIPPEFHGHLKEHLSKNDKYVQEVQQSYAPWKEFADNGIGKDQVEQWGQLAALFENNPRGVFDYLNQTYNYIPTGQQSQGQQAQAPVELGDNPPAFDISQDPRFQQVAQMAQFSAAQVQQMEQQHTAELVNAEIQSEVSKLQNEYPNIPLEFVIKQALGTAATKGPNVKADLIEAAKELTAMGIGRGTRAPAPPNLSNRNRGLPSSEISGKDLASMTRQERSALFADMARAASGDS
jgi:hypothetical protein